MHILPPGERSLFEHVDDFGSWSRMNVTRRFEIRIIEHVSIRIAQGLAGPFPTVWVLCFASLAWLKPDRKRKYNQTVPGVFASYATEQRNYFAQRRFIFSLRSREEEQEEEEEEGGSWLGYPSVPVYLAFIYRKESIRACMYNDVCLHSFSSAGLHLINDIGILYKGHYPLLWNEHPFACYICYLLQLFFTVIWYKLRIESRLLSSDRSIIICTTLQPNDLCRQN